MSYQSTPIRVDATVLPFNPNASGPPVATRQFRVSSGKSSVGSEEVKALRTQGFTTGLAESLSDVKSSFPLRIWVVDNSGSMQKVDGHRIVSTRSKNDMKIVDCTRWDEIKEAVTYHIQMSALLEAPTTFRLLNNPGITAGAQQFDIAQMGKEMIPQEVSEAVNLMAKVRPGGVTPLTEHIQDIHSLISGLSSSLEPDGQKVAVIIATDGLPTDAHGHSNKAMKDQFVRSLRMLEGLPVWVVIRLCTDEEDVVQFYNDLDDQLELSMDVLDDFVGEAEEVYGHNKWLNYALPLHRMREMGYHDRVFDMLDERTLTKGELRDFCRLLFGIQNFDGVPDPNEDWATFLADIDRLLKKEGLQYNPIKKKMMPWIDLKRLHKIYGDGDGCSIM